MIEKLIDYIHSIAQELKKIDRVRRGRFNNEYESDSVKARERKLAKVIEKWMHPQAARYERDMHKKTECSL